jgi:hypothetical protein
MEHEIAIERYMVWQSQITFEFDVQVYFPAIVHASGLLLLLRT